MQKLITKLAGYKTYILAVVTAVYNLLVATNTITAHQKALVNSLLASGIAAAIHAAIVRKN